MEFWFQNHRSCAPTFPADAVNIHVYPTGSGLQFSGTSGMGVMPEDPTFDMRDKVTAIVNVRVRRRLSNCNRCEAKGSALIDFLLLLTSTLLYSSALSSTTPRSTILLFPTRLRLITAMLSAASARENHCNGF